MHSISLCLIVRNEAERLANCLQSAQPAIDEIIVVDTGSSDATVAIAREHGARVFPFEWCGDFSAPRNESLRHATGDWILVLDADECLTPVGADKIRRLSAQSDYDACLLQTRSPYHLTSALQRIATGLAVRFFRNRPELRYAGALHESVDVKAAGPGIRTGVANVVIEHLGYMGEVREKYRRNYAITRAPWTPTPFRRFDLARRDVALGQSDEAVERLQQMVSDVAVAPWLKAQSHLLLGDLKFSRGDTQDAFRAWRSAAALDPCLTAPLLRLGSSQYRSGDYAGALGHFREAIRLLEMGGVRGAILDDEMPLAEAYSWATFCCLELGLEDEAREYVRKFEAPQTEDLNLRIVPFAPPGG